MIYVNHLTTTKKNVQNVIVDILLLMGNVLLHKLKQILKLVIVMCTIWIVSVYNALIDTIWKIILVLKLMCFVRSIILGLGIAPIVILASNLVEPNVCVNDGLLIYLHLHTYIDININAVIEVSSYSQQQCRSQINILYICI